MPDNLSSARVQLMADELGKLLGEQVQPAADEYPVNATPGGSESVTVTVPRSARVPFLVTVNV